jgi:hypothetical protein
VTIKAGDMYCGRPKITHTCPELEHRGDDEINREWNPWKREGCSYDEWSYTLVTGCRDDSHSYPIKFCPHCGTNLEQEEAANPLTEL